MKKIITINAESSINILITGSVTNSQLFEIANLLKNNITLINSGSLNEFINLIKQTTGVELELIETIAEYNIKS